MDAIFDFTPPPVQPSIWDAALGLAQSAPLERIRTVRAGLSAAAFDQFSKAAGVTREDLAKAVGLSLRTVQRREEVGLPLDPGPSERLVRLAELYALATQVIGDEASARRWMGTPRPVFGGQTPFELAHSELGAREVERLLHRVEHGVFY